MLAAFSIASEAISPQDCVHYFKMLESKEYHGLKWKYDHTSPKVCHVDLRLILVTVTFLMSC